MLLIYNDLHIYDCLYYFFFVDFAKLSGFFVENLANIIQISKGNYFLLYLLDYNGKYGLRLPLFRDISARKSLFFLVSNPLALMS